MFIFVFVIYCAIPHGSLSFNVITNNERIVTARQIQQQHLQNADSINYEQKLLESLMRSYNKKLRPPGTVQLKFAFNLNQIINLVEKDQIILLNAFIDHEWIDSRLVWDPEEYGNLTVVRITSDKLWTPDTFIYTTADHNGFLLPQNGANFVVRHTGAIFWPNPMTQMRVKCRMGIVWFPFDEQLCELVFGSWSFTMDYLNYSLMIESPDLSNYTENSEWLLMAFKAYRYEIKYENWIEDDEFSEIRYKMVLKRKPLFVITNCIIPALMLSVLSLTSFFIPFAQEMQIGISIMLAYSVFTLRLSDDVPSQSDSVPLVNIYFLLCMAFSLSAMVWFSIINKLREVKALSRTCKRFAVLYLSCMVCRKKTRSVLIKSYLKIFEVNKQLIKEEAEKKQQLACVNDINKSKEITTKVIPNTAEGPSSYEKIWIPIADSLDFGERYNSNTNIKSSTPIKYNQFLNINITTQEQLYDNGFCKPHHQHHAITKSTSKSPVNFKKPEIKKKAKQKKASKVGSPPKISNSNDELNSTIGSVVAFENRFLTRDQIYIQIFDIINRTVFILFLLFIVNLNLVVLIVCPYILKKPLTINDSV